MSRTKRLWVDLPVSLEARLRRTADRLGIPRSEALRKSVEEYVNRHDLHEPVTPREINQGAAPIPESWHSMLPRGGDAVEVKVR